MIKKLKIIWIFYRKLLVPAVLFSLLFTFQTGFTIRNFGFCFLIIFPAFHFLIYELRFKNEYVFFANFGFSRQWLWIMTVSVSLIVNLVSKLWLVNFTSTALQNPTAQKKFCGTSAWPVKPGKLLPCWEESAPENQLCFKLFSEPLKEILNLLNLMTRFSRSNLTEETELPIFPKVRSFQKISESKIWSLYSVIMKIPKNCINMILSARY